jgi:hypothetical protein
MSSGRHLIFVTRPSVRRTRQARAGRAAAKLERVWEQAGPAPDRPFGPSGVTTLEVILNHRRLD